jgi:hypothetical protein
VKRISLLAAFLIAPTIAVAAESITILGLPLGGKLASSPKVCPKSAIGNPSNKALCWIDAPYVYPPTGSKYGHVAMPETERLPQWAAYAMYKASVSKSDELESLELKTTSGNIAGEIERAISSRFGKPTKAAISGRNPSAEWRHRDVSIKYLCDGATLCLVEFTSAKKRAKNEREMVEREKIDARRAISP